MTQLYINVTRLVTMPSICRYQQLDELLDGDGFEEYNELVCEVLSDGILRRNGRIELQFFLDTYVLTVPSLTVSVRVGSASDERNEMDNRYVLDLEVVERSAIEVVGYVVYEIHVIISLNLLIS